jgi:hypothetical protein
MTNSPTSPSRQIAVRRFQKSLGKALSQQYAAVIAEPLPDAFLQLLSSIDERSPSQGSLTSSTMIVSKLPSSR